MASIVYHHMLCFEVSVDHSFAVEMLECTQDFSCIELHVVSHLHLFGPDTTNKITASDELHLYVEVIVVMERLLGLHDEWTLILLFGKI